MPPSPTGSAAPGNAGVESNSSSSGLSTSDIIGIAVGVPSAVFALVGVIIAYVTLRKKGNLQQVASQLPLSRQGGNRFFNIKGRVTNLIGGDYNGDQIRSPRVEGHVDTINLHRG